MEAVFIGTRNDADATLLIQGPACVLIDAGEEGDARVILNLLEEKGVTEIALMILTHPDADHIGGAAQILEVMPVNRVVQPLNTKESALLEELNEIISEKNIPVTYPTRTRKLYTGEMKLLVYPPLERHYKRDNNYSLAILASHGRVNLVFCGDAEEKRLREMMGVHWPAVTVYHAAHHGRASPLTEEFIHMLSPEYIIVPASGCDEAVRSAGGAVGAEIYYTGENSVTFWSNVMACAVKGGSGGQNEY